MVLRTGMENGAAISYDRLEEVARELQRRESSDDAGVATRAAGAAWTSAVENERRTTALAAQ